LQRDGNVFHVAARYGSAKALKALIAYIDEKKVRLFSSPEDQREGRQEGGGKGGKKK
jgi:hypothetical protein